MRIGGLEMSGPVRDTEINNYFNSFLHFRGGCAILNVHKIGKLACSQKRSPGDAILRGFF